MEKISVVIPVYKVEPYLRQCMDSVVNQTYTNLEIIAVDDGSPDNCGAILDEYASKDNRIKVIHKKNEGLSAARNDALKFVTGKWISFVDSDDWCESDLYEKAIKEAERSQPDIVIFSPYKNTPQEERRIHAFSKGFETEDKDVVFQVLLSSLNSRYNPFPSAQRWGQEYPWDKLFRTSLIRDNNIRFAENVRANEDVIFNIHALHYSKKLLFFDEALYHWRMNPDSIGHKYTEDRVTIDLDIYKELNKIGQLYDLPRQYYDALNVRIITNTIHLGWRCLYNAKRDGSLLSKMKYAREVLHTEPIYTAYKRVDRSKLGKIGRLITVYPSPWLLYFATQCIRVFNLN